MEHPGEGKNKKNECAKNTYAGGVRFANTSGFGKALYRLSGTNFDGYRRCVVILICISSDSNIRGAPQIP